MSRTKEYRPIVNLPDTSIEKIYDGVSLACMILLVFGAIAIFAYLPDEIPIHWNLKGEADGFGSKNMLFVTPLLSVLFYFTFAWIAKRPHTYNYLQKLTPENYEHQYLTVRKLLRIVHAISQIIFVVLLGFMVRGALGEEQNIPSWFILLVLFVMIVIPIIYAYRSVEK